VQGAPEVAVDGVEEAAARIGPAGHPLGGGAVGRVALEVLRGGVEVRVQTRSRNL